jgi:hypothetical protein
MGRPERSPRRVAALARSPGTRPPGSRTGERKYPAPQPWSQRRRKPNTPQEERLPYAYLQDEDVQILREALDVLDSVETTTLAGMAADALRDVLEEITG